MFVLVSQTTFPSSGKESANAFLLPGSTISVIGQELPGMLNIETVVVVEIKIR